MLDRNEEKWMLFEDFSSEAIVQIFQTRAVIEVFHALAKLNEGNLFIKGTS